MIYLIFLYTYVIYGWRKCKNPNKDSSYWQLTVPIWSSWNALLILRCCIKRYKLMPTGTLFWHLPNFYVEKWWRIFYTRTFFSEKRPILPFLWYASEISFVCLNWIFFYRFFGEKWFHEFFASKWLRASSTDTVQIVYLVYY